MNRTSYTSTVSLESDRKAAHERYEAKKRAALFNKYIKGQLEEISKEIEQIKNTLEELKETCAYSTMEIYKDKLNNLNSELNDILNAK